MSGFKAYGWGIKDEKLSFLASIFLAVKVFMQFVCVDIVLITWLIPVLLDMSWSVVF